MIFTGKSFRYIEALLLLSGSQEAEMNGDKRKLDDLQYKYFEISVDKRGNVEIGSLSIG